jgi:hypothetical protein
MPRKSVTPQIPIMTDFFPSGGRLANCARLAPMVLFQEVLGLKDRPELFDKVKVCWPHCIISDAF